MAARSSDKKGDIAINSNMAYSLVKRRNCGRMKKRSGSGSERGGRVGGGGNNHDYEVPSTFDSNFPSQVSGESSLVRGGGGYITPPHPPPAATSTGGGGGEESVYEDIPGGQCGPGLDPYTVTYWSI